MGGGYYAREGKVQKISFKILKKKMAFLKGGYLIPKNRFGVFEGGVFLVNYPDDCEDLRHVIHIRRCAIVCMVRKNFIF